jgi:hypothetical protein
MYAKGEGLILQTVSQISLADSKDGTAAIAAHNGAVLPLSSAQGGAGPMALMLWLDLVI